MKFHGLSIAVATATVSLSLLTGCPGHIEGGPVEPCVPAGLTTTPPATFATVREALKGGGEIANCASAPCHGLGGMAPPPPKIPLILQDDANLYHNMMGYTSVACGNVPLVNPGNPNESGLIKILSGPCGTTPRMPFLCTDVGCFSAETMAAISAWIDNCAPEN
jgi:hypothetical protein